MKWVNKNIATISFVWWFIQGLALSLNSLRCFLEYNELYPKQLIIGIVLIVVAGLLFIRKKKIRLFLSSMLVLYSVISLVFVMLLLLIWGIHLAQWLFLFVPILNLILSVKLIQKKDVILI
jgi:LPXTG-motif cell wall-anchored protein